MANNNSREQERQARGNVKAANVRQQPGAAADKKLNGPNRPST